MPLYEFLCTSCGHFFERLLPVTRQEVSCPQCGELARKVLSAFSVASGADPGPMRAAWPHSWEATHGGDPEVLRYWRRRIEREMKLEERYPELRPSPADVDGAMHHHGHPHRH